MIQKFSMMLTPFNEVRRIFVYLPDDYETSGERYPVTYMFDGQNLFEDSDATYGTCWGLKDFLDNWNKEMIVVGIECAKTGPERAKEYLPFTVETGFYGLIQGECEKTYQWIIRELKPYIDEHFRTWSHREATAIAGSSYGGAASCYGILFHNDVFSKAALVSPSVNTLRREALQKIHSGKLHPDTRIYFSIGSEEGGKDYGHIYENMCREMEQAANKAGCMTYFYYQENGHHHERDWAKQSDLWLNFLWK